LIVSRGDGKNKSAPVPATPRTGGQRYRNVQQIHFRSRAAYFGTISDLRAINSTARWLMQQISNCQLIRLKLSSKTMVALSLAVRLSEKKEMTHIAWTMFDTSRQRVLDQHYVIDRNAGESNGNEGTAISISVERALKVLEQDVSWAMNRDKKLVLLAYDVPKCLLALKHHGWTRPWSAPDSVDSIVMFGLRDIYEVMSCNLGHRAPLSEIVHCLQLPPYQPDVCFEAKSVLQGALILCTRPVPTVEEFGDLSRVKQRSPVTE